ncbi:hypothetical protein TNCV_3639511 [Trichonephila clavipes]|nr:hypothetical protein TNCV_3639511 [Trichonephila clavipes]
MVRAMGIKRPLPGHIIFGSIRVRRLPSGVPPPTTEYNKRGSVPVIGHRPDTALTWSTSRIQNSVCNCPLNKICRFHRDNSR